MHQQRSPACLSFDIEGLAPEENYTFFSICLNKERAHIERSLLKGNDGTQKQI